MEVKLELHNSLQGEIEVPGDKSISHRAVMLGSIAEGTTEISNFLDAKDPWSTVNCMRSLGVEIDGEGSNLRVHGVGLQGLTEPQDVLDAGNSGTTIRLISGILAGQDFHSVITGDNSLRRRPMGRIAQPLKEMGAKIDGRNGGNLAPLSIRGGSLKGIEYQLKVASAQVKSAILLAGLFAQGETVITEPGNSRDHTERMLTGMGYPLKKEGRTVTLQGGHSLKGLKIRVPGDFSSAAFFMVAASIVEGSDLTIKGVGLNPTRTGLLKVLKEMGAEIKVADERLSGGEPVADLMVKGSKLRAVEVGGDIIPTMIDEIPVLAVAAAVAEGKTVIRDAAELKVKESNRISTIAQELAKMGADIKELPDGLEISGGRKLKGTVCHSHDDHRIAMALAVASLVAEGETVITSWDSVEISFPGFLDLLKKCLAVQ